MDQSDIEDKKNLFEDKKQEINEKRKERLQRIESTLADIAAAPDELVGQSNEYISRKIKKLQDKVDKQTEKVKVWVDDKISVAEKWMSDKIEQISKSINEEIIQKIEIEKINNQLKAAAIISAKTGIDLPEIPEPEFKEDKQREIPPVLTQYSDDDYNYFYKNDWGKYIQGLGKDVAERKRYRSDIYTDPDDKLRIAGIRRETKKKES